MTTPTLRELAEKAKEAEDKIRGPHTLGTAFAILSQEIAEFYGHTTPTAILALLDRESALVEALTEITTYENYEPVELKTAMALIKSMCDIARRALEPKP